MSREILLDERGKLHLFRDANSRRASLLHDDGGILLTLELWPGWRCASPLAAVRAMMETLQPKPPRIVEIKAKEFCGAAYCAGDDTILVFGVKRMSDDELAGTLLHEIGHCVGHRCRMGRPDFASATITSSQAQAELAFRPQALPEFLARIEDEVHGVRQEELTAVLCGALVAVRIGIDPTATEMGAVGWPAWFKRASGLPLDDLKQGIADVKAGASFILNDLPPTA